MIVPNKNQIVGGVVKNDGFGVGNVEHAAITIM